MFQRQQSSQLSFMDQQIITNLLTNDKNFWFQVQSIVRKVNQQVRFIQKEKYQKNKNQYNSNNINSNYPWNNVQTNQAVDQMQAILINIIDQNLHKILNQQFINVSNQILIIRDQVTNFIYQQNQRNKAMQEQMGKQIQQMKKKIATNSILQKSSPITLTNNGPRYMRSSANMDTSQKKINNQIIALKEEVQKLKKSSYVLQQSNIQNQDISHLQESMLQIRMETKTKLEQIKQKYKRQIQLLQLKIKEGSAKDQISSQVKKAIQANLKIYKQQLNGIKIKYSQIIENVGKQNESIKQYIGAQLKSSWLILSNLKRRLEVVEQHCDVANSSFIMQ